MLVVVGLRDGLTGIVEVDDVAIEINRACKCLM